MSVIGGVPNPFDRPVIIVAAPLLGQYAAFRNSRPGARCLDGGRRKPRDDRRDSRTAGWQIRERLELARSASCNRRYCGSASHGISVAPDRIRRSARRSPLSRRVASRKLSRCFGHSVARDDYVERAVRIGSDREMRERIRKALIASLPVVCGGAEVIRGIESFFRAVARVKT